MKGLLIRIMKSLTLFFLFTLLAPVPTTKCAASPLETIQTQIAKFLERPEVRSVEWGIQILDPSAHEVLLEVNPDKAFLPASVLKVVTTSAALEKLGPDFQFRTGVYTNGMLETGGVASGDLMLVGRGDPNLIPPQSEFFGKPALVELAEKLQSLGIKKIEGDILGNDSYFDTNSYGKGWTARDLRSAYGAPPNALSINNNVFWVKVRPAKYNEPVRVSIEPRTSYFRIKNSGETGTSRSKQTLRIWLKPGTKTIVISGVLPSTKTCRQHIILEKPGEVTTTMFKEELKRHGIAIGGKVRMIHHGDPVEHAQQSWSLLAEYRSPPLIHALEIINKQSQNMHAEMLLRTLGASFKGEGTNEAGLDVIREFLVEAGINSDKIQMNDGCGLSRQNFLTPRFQTSLLAFLAERPCFDLFLNTLAVGGTDGTLKNRFSTEMVRGSIHAKTGYLRGVMTLSGYMTTVSGRNLVFSIFANNVNSTARVKKTIDQICTLFVNLY
jgi:D-alanyl-D-alanine carboxypeptidase/D-alanyl-D-alanine-endopeptidase (penicillin-binding protein 4)